MKKFINKKVKVEISKSRITNPNTGEFSCEFVEGILTSIQDDTATIHVEGHGQNEDDLRIVQLVDIVTIRPIEDNAVMVAKNLFKHGVIANDEYVRILKEKL